MTPTTSPAPLRNQQPGNPPALDFLSRVSTSGGNLPSRTIMYGEPGVGKTSFWTHAPKPLFLQFKGETGLGALIDAGLVRPTPHNPDEILLWSDAKEVLKEFERSAKAGKFPYKTLVLEAGWEGLLHDHVLNTTFKGDQVKFEAFLNGEKASLRELRSFLFLLDKLRRQGIQVVMVLHSHVQNKKNTDSEDYGVHAPLMSRYTNGVVYGWAENLYFAQFSVSTAKIGGKAKGLGGKKRIMHVEKSAGHEAKNRNGLTCGFVSMGESSAEAWSNFIAAIKEARKQNQGGEKT